MHGHLNKDEKYMYFMTKYVVNMTRSCLMQQIITLSPKATQCPFNHLSEALKRKNVSYCIVNKNDSSVCLSASVLIVGCHDSMINEPRCE